MASILCSITITHPTASQSTPEVVESEGVEKHDVKEKGILKVDQVPEDIKEEDIDTRLKKVYAGLGESTMCKSTILMSKGKRYAFAKIQTVKPVISDEFERKFSTETLANIITSSYIRTWRGSDPLSTKTIKKLQTPDAKQWVD